MAGEAGAGLVERLDVFIGEEALDGEGCVHRGARVAFGAHQLVPFRPMGVFRAVAHNVSVEHREKIAHTERAPDVAEAPRLELFHRADADARRQRLEFPIRFHECPPGWKCFSFAPSEALIRRKAWRGSSRHGPAFQAPRPAPPAPKDRVSGRCGARNRPEGH